jgi:hypothetical protein
MSELVAIRTKPVFDPQQPLAAIRMPSLPASEVGQLISRRIEHLARSFSPSLSRVTHEETKPRGLAERLYDARSAAKLLTSQVSMHLDRAWRDRLFRQLDGLLELESWDEGDEVLANTSFATFLRMVLHFGPSARPALGQSYRGNVLADWTVDQDSLTIEFLPLDEVRWVVMRTFEGERESAAGQSPLRRLTEVLAPYQPDRWFKYADEHRS